MDEDKKLEFQDKKIDQLTHELAKEGKRNFGESLQQAVAGGGVLKDQGVELPPVVPVETQQSTAQPENLQEEKNKATSELYAVVKPLRTYERDIADSIRSKETSVVSIKVAEEKRKVEQHTAGAVVEKTEKVAQKSFVLIISVVLIIAGIAIAGLLWFMYKTKPTPVIQTPTSLITTDLKDDLNVSDLSFTQISTTIEQKEKDQLDNDKLLRIFLFETIGADKRQISVEKFFGTFGRTAPPSLVRALGPEWLFGFHHVDANEPFVLFSVNSFDNAFDGTLRWEKDMVQNLGPIFIKSGTDIVTSSAIAGSGFEDEVIKSKDVRVLKDSLGNDVILYSFLDAKNLVITTNEKTFREILTRFFASQIVR